jgi:hypothetical protein
MSPVGSYLGGSTRGMAPTHQIGNAKEKRDTAVAPAPAPIVRAKKACGKEQPQYAGSLPSCVFLHAGRTSPTRWPCGGLQ